MKKYRTLLDIHHSRIKKCQKCGEEITFLKSSRTGKFYPVNCYNEMAYATDFHTCRPAEPAPKPQEDGMSLDDALEIARNMGLIK